VNTSDSDVSAVRPAARKSQIIEEEEDDDGIEEVDEFDDPVTPGTPGDMVISDRDVTPKVSIELESPGRTPFAPVPNLETSPLRPPRSSSLRSPGKTE
jgi:hypothetical protein